MKRRLSSQVDNNHYEDINPKEAIDNLINLIPECNLKSFPPLFFAHQLYFNYSNRNLIDESLHNMRRLGVISMLKLNATDHPSSFGYVFKSHFIVSIREKLGESLSGISEKFVKWITVCNNTSVFRNELLAGTTHLPNFQDDEIDLLVSNGFLSERRENDTSTSLVYWLSLPGVCFPIAI